jgi:ubiquinone/menaquinone biosynthesis C-methylase UbiE
MPSIIPFNAKSPVAYLDKVSTLEPVKAYKRTTWELLKVQPGECILDVGCGTGEDAIAFARYMPRASKVVGIDRDLVMIAEAWRRVAGHTLPVEFKVADIHNLDFADNSFHGCRSDRVFQHLEDPACALSEMMRVLHPGGRIVISDPDWATLVIDGPDPKVTRKIVAFICDVQIRNSDMGRKLRSLFQRMKLKNIMASAGAVLITNFPLADQVWSLQKNAAEALTAGAITEQEHTEWRRAVSHTTESNNFLGACTGFIVSAVKA